jgi:hypothetical protein
MQAINLSKRTFSGEHNCICTKINETLILALVAGVLNLLILHFSGQRKDALACIEL